MKEFNSSVQRDMILFFVADMKKQLDEVKVLMDSLEKGVSRDNLEALYNRIHTMNKMGAHLGFENLQGLTAHLKTLLETILDTPGEDFSFLQEECQNILGSTLSLLQKLLETVEQGSRDSEPTTLVQQQMEFLNECLTKIKQGKKDPVLPIPEPSHNFLETSSLVTKDMVDLFIAECLELVDKTEKIALGLLDTSMQFEEVNDIFRAIHTIKGNSGFFGYSLLESKCMEFETLLDQVRKGTVPVDECFINTAISKIDGFRSIMNSLEVIEPTPSSGRETPIIKTENISPPSPKIPREEYKPLGEILMDLGVTREDEIEKALEEQERPLGEILIKNGAIKSEDLNKALEVQRLKNTTPEPGQKEESLRKEIRVDTAKLDKLFDLVGELITAESMVLNSSDLKGLKLDNLMKSFSGLNKISREIQETTMMIRMIPLEGLFQKMTRLVRDLSRKFEKPMGFKISGQETEMDKNVIEMISDPLVHILRNAIDHGVENKVQRLAAGKSETGTINLTAKYEGSEIWISVKDDGRGLVRSKILDKALSVGLLSGDPQNLSDHDVWNLIFEPGFSTAETVSEVSGRGVGMDVVKKNLERIRGKVDILTKEGEGTEFILKIPLTMAIIEGITIRAGQNYYSIPLGDILEFFKAHTSQITKAEHEEELVNLRGNIMPLVKFGEVFKIPGAELDPTKGTIIVVQNGGRKACILIDEVVGNQQIVVKSLSEYLGKVEGISGCSILGDGRVSFIIDTARLISRKLL